MKRMDDVIATSDVIKSISSYNVINSIDKQSLLQRRAHEPISTVKILRNKLNSTIVEIIVVIGSGN